MAEMEYFVNRPEYDHIMELIAQLGGLDVEALLEAITDIGSRVTTLETAMENTDRSLEAIIDDISTIDDEVFDMQDAETARNTWHDILAWGNYYTAGQTLLLMDDLSLYDFIILTAGFSSPDTQSGHGTLYIPKGYYNTGGHETVSFWVGTTEYKVTVKFIDNTHIQIVNCTNATLGLRAIVGKRS